MFTGKNQKSGKLNNRKRRIPLSVYLTYLIVCTLLLTGVSFSKYVSSAEGSDRARVAAFIVAANGDSNKQVEIDSNNSSNMTTSYNVRVTNNVNNSISEVSLKYAIIIDGKLPENVSVQLDGKAPTISGNTYVFDNIGSFQANVGATNTHTLCFILSNDAVVTAALSADMDIKVIAEQVD